MTKPKKEKYTFNYRDTSWGLDEATLGQLLISAADAARRFQMAIFDYWLTATPHNRERFGAVRDMLMEDSHEG